MSSDETPPDEQPTTNGGDGASRTVAPQSRDLPGIDEWIKGQSFESTADIDVPKKLLDQVIGQEHAVTVVRKASEQKRHVMLIGDPGTGKSMLARAMTEFLPREELEDIICYPNPDDNNQPRIRVVPAGKGKEIVEAQKLEARKKQEQRTTFMLVIMVVIIALSIWYAITSGEVTVLFFGIFAALILFWIMRATGNRSMVMMVPKLLVTHSPDELPPFIDATAAHSGALLGDVRHDPFQAGGLETPAHDRVEAGSIHKAHKGVLYIDEINTLHIQSQQHLLTAIQERKFQITGQSERSSGAMVKTEPVPCDFILVAAGNLDAVEGMHPALRSRIRGYGYEVYVKSDMEDDEDNRRRLIRFVAQEVVKDGKIPHFDRSGVAEIIREGQRRAGRKGKLTLRLRELGGLVRVAGDLAKEEGAELAVAEHVVRAKKVARSLEQQIADRYIEIKKLYKQFKTEGAEVGMVNGLAVMSGDPSMSEHSGLVLPIVAEVTPASSRGEGKIIATGKLGDIAKEAVLNISAIVKKFMGKDVSNHDVHIQFVGASEGVEGDSASVSVATAVISTLEGVKIRQDIGMTGSLSIRGAVLPVGGVTAKIEAAADSGLKRVLIPAPNRVDVILEDKYQGEIEVVAVDTIWDVLREATTGPGKDELLEKLKRLSEQFGQQGEAAPKKKKAADEPEEPANPKPGRRLPGGTGVPG